MIEKQKDVATRDEKEQKCVSEGHPLRCFGRKHNTTPAVLYINGIIDTETAFRACTNERRKYFRKRFQPDRHDLANHSHNSGRGIIQGPFFKGAMH